MEKNKISPELQAKILREHAEMLTLLKYAPQDSSSEDYKEWLGKRDNIISKIQKIEPV
ncbi:MAG: hypothetical protein JJT78_07130 [Leptospira sp.]|nr:hypothetical protein [Leptospira sp.]